MITITITNEKGGVGKTTTAQQLSTGLAKKGYKVLAIDLDNQRNLSSCFGDRGQEINRAYDLLHDKKASECIFKTEQNVFIIYGDDRLSNIDIEFGNDVEAPYLLKDKIEEVEEMFDFCIIDTPPKSKSMVVLNSFTASNKIIIPLQANSFSVEGLGKILDTYKQVKKRTNPNIEIDGLLLTMFDERAVLRREISEQLQGLSKEMNIPLFKNSIRRSVAIEEAQSQRMNIFDYQRKSKVAEDYFNLVEEVEERNKDILK